jgi:ABC-type antimicrobial peptide transport system permease subunit
MSRPPKSAKILLRMFSSQEREDAYFGDIEEVFSDRADDLGLSKAKRWYWREILRAIPRFAQESIRWSFTMIRNYLKVALRNLARHKGYSFINIFGLAVGMACCILILLWVFDELSFDRFHEDLDSLYQIVISNEENSSWLSSPWAIIPALKNDFPEVIQGSQYYDRTILMKVDDRLFNEHCALAQPDFLKMFSFPFIKGNAENAFIDKNSIVLTEETAKKYFGDDDPMGKVIQFNSRTDLQVTGVIENIPTNSTFQFDLMVNAVSYFGEARLKTWSMDCPGFVRLEANTDPHAFSLKIRDTINKYDKRTNNKYYTSLRPAASMHLYSVYGTDPVIYVYLFSIVALIVLLIACVNFMNLATARSFKRAREVGMRKVVGASRGDIIRQFLGESFLLVSIAIVFSLALVKLLLPAFNTLAQKELVLSAGDAPTLAVLFISIIMITGLLSGSYPAFYLSSFRPLFIMKKTRQKGSKNQTLRKALIVFQFSAAVILIVCTAIIFHQMKFIQNQDLGLNKDQIVIVPMSREVRTRYPFIKNKLRQEQNIVSITAASNVPLSIRNMNPVYWEGRGPDNYESFSFVCCDYDYFETFDMDMAHGRTFSKEFPTDKGNYIINEKALRMTGYENPIGSMFSMWTQEGQIVGVVKDFQASTLRDEIRPIVFMLYENIPYRHMFVKIGAAQVPQTLAKIEATIKETVPNFVFDYTFLDEYFARQYLQEERLKNLLKYFAGLAILVSCLGMLGLISFMAEQRTKEVAIRKILGARNATIVGLLSKEFLILVGISNLIAWPIAYYLMHKWLQGFVFHAGIAWWIFALTGAAAVLITMFTVSFQSIKAAVADPVNSLRYE